MVNKLHKDLEYQLNEKQAWQELLKGHKWVKAHAAVHDRLQRMENVAADGLPDVNGCINGNEFWMELKTPRIPVRDTTPLFGSNHKITPNQFAWFKAQSLAGGMVFLLISCANVRLHYLINASKINSDFLLYTLDEIDALDAVCLRVEGVGLASFYPMVRNFIATRRGHR